MVSLVRLCDSRSRPMEDPAAAGLDHPLLLSVEVSAWCPLGRNGRQARHAWLTHITEANRHRTLQRPRYTFQRYSAQSSPCSNRLDHPEGDTIPTPFALVAPRVVDAGLEPDTSAAPPPY